MRVETLTESRPAAVRLSRTEADALVSVGRQLASGRGRFGEVLDDASLIRCEQRDSVTWLVTVRDAVGLVVVGDLQLAIMPKIPPDHFLWLLEQSRGVPSGLSQRGRQAPGASFWQLIALWFIAELERLVRLGLLRDYRETTTAEPALRGTPHLVAIAQDYYRGRLQFLCTHDEFDIDVPLNQLLKRAAIVVAGAPSIGPTVRARASRIVRQLADLTEWRAGSRIPQLERRSAYYAASVSLATSIVEGTARSLASGALPAWTFLLRTPNLIERGVRSVLASAFGERLVQKRQVQLPGSRVTLNPDVVICHPQVVAVGDIKYKVTGNEWNRQDLYQSVSFAVGFGVQHAAILDFATDVAPRAALQVGDVTVSHLPWPAAEDLTAEEASASMIGQTAAWLAFAGAPVGQ